MWLGELSSILLIWILPACASGHVKATNFWLLVIAQRNSNSSTPISPSPNPPLPNSLPPSLPAKTSTNCKSQLLILALQWCVATSLLSIPQTKIPWMISTTTIKTTNMTPTRLVLQGFHSKLLIKIMFKRNHLFFPF